MRKYAVMKNLWGGLQKISVICILGFGVTICYILLLFLLQIFPVDTGLSISSHLLPITVMSDLLRLVFSSAIIFLFQ
jgi:hypothetical protein